MYLLKVLRRQTIDIINIINVVPVSGTVYCKSSYHPYMEKRRMRTVVYANQNTCDITVAYFTASVMLLVAETETGRS